MRRLAFFVAQGPDRGRVYELTAPGGTIGRGADAAIPLSDPTVSRVHAEVTLGSSGATEIASRGGKNPLLVNDAVVETTARLRPGDRISLGTSILLVGALAEEAPPARVDRPGSTVSFPVAVVGGARLVGVVGRSPAFARAQEMVARVAPTDVTVLVTGESGTGKELAARAIHYNSPRASGPFIVVDCGALPGSLIEVELFGCERGAFTGADRARSGRFEQANGGTIFLDEIGELPLESQPKLLRVLEERRVRRVGATREVPVDVRVVAATNRDLDRAVAERRFRPDLYFRLAVAPVALPALRERPEDVEELARYYCDRFALECGRRIETIAPETLARFRAYRWPGNVRELKNAIRAALALGSGEVLRPEEFRFADPTPPPQKAVAAGGPGATSTTLTLHDEREERARITEALRAAGGNKTRAAELLGIGRTTLYEKLQRFEREDAESASRPESERV